MNWHSVDNQYEKRLLEKLRVGDHDAFEQIYHIYKDRLIGNLLQVLKSRDVVEELVQDIFLNIWKGRKRIDPKQPFKAYIFRIAANMANNTLRRIYYDQRMRATLLPLDQRTYKHVEENITKEEHKLLLDNILSNLPPQRRKVFTLCKLEGRSYKEVSELLNISENTVNDHIRKANLTLQKIHIDPKVIGFLVSCIILKLG